MCAPNITKLTDRYRGNAHFFTCHYQEKALSRKFRVSSILCCDMYDIGNSLFECFLVNFWEMSDRLTARDSCHEHDRKKKHRFFLQSFNLSKHVIACLQGQRIPAEIAP